MQYGEARGRAAYREVLARIRALPGVTAVGMASAVPFGEFHEGHAVERVGGPSRSDLPQHVNATYRIVGADYFRALRLPMVRGRVDPRPARHPQDPADRPPRRLPSPADTGVRSRFSNLLIQHADRK